MDMSNPPDSAEGQPTAPGRDFVTLLVLAMLVGTAGMLVAMWFTFRGNPTYLLFGGYMALSASGLLIVLTKPTRGRVLLLGVGTVGMLVVLFIADRGGPTAMWSAMMALFICGVAFAALRASRNAGSTEDEAKR